LRRRALACVAKLAGPLGESMAWSGAAAMRRRKSGRRRCWGKWKPRGGVKNWEWMEKRLRGERRWGFQLYPLYISPQRWRLPIGSRQSRQIQKRNSKSVNLRCVQVLTAYMKNCKPTSRRNSSSIQQIEIRRLGATSHNLDENTARSFFCVGEVLFCMNVLC
jgi:hypothetical protein